MKTYRDSKGKVMLATVEIGSMTLNVWHRRYGGRIGAVFRDGGKFHSVGLSRGDAKRLIAKV